MTVEIQYERGYMIIDLSALCQMKRMHWNEKCKKIFKMMCAHLHGYEMDLIQHHLKGHHKGYYMEFIKIRNKGR